MKVLITGHKGYIGTHLVELLKQRGDYVIGCDLNLFDGCQWESLVSPDEELIKDFRQLTIDELKDVDCVMHLAAISNDPMGDLDEELTYDVNLHGSIKLAEISKRAGVKRFLYSSSCSIYGKGEHLDLDENSPLNPVSAYAASKIEAERGIAKLADEKFTPVFLRNSTAYGFSPMLRIDLVANNLLGSAFTKNEIRIMSDGTPWRPLIHCRDIARAFVALNLAPAEVIKNKQINIGDNKENYQVRNIADMVQELIPSADVRYTGEVGADPRNYRVKFDLLNQLLPDFRLEYDLKKGLNELFDKFKQHNFSEADFDGDKFVRLRTLRKRLQLLVTEKKHGL
ncbi:MAG: SDR family oxidoreductase [Ignavibacteriaceae bacterium]|nr:SDR family oxidoreductase [Ignavibacteriaceae bacterium]